MQNSNIPTEADLPSTEKLIKSTVAAIAVAVVLLLVAVLPAEYGIDPTGVGKVLGLKRMGEIKVSLDHAAVVDHIQEQAVDSQPSPSAVEAKASSPAPESANTSLTQSHEMKVSLAPNATTEIKVVMEEGGKVRYKWWSDGGLANFNVHGDSKKLNIDYHNYSKGSDRKGEGVIEAAFDGSHGWFWRNRTDSEMSITLQTSGEYSEIMRLE